MGKRHTASGAAHLVQSTGPLPAGESQQPPPGPQQSLVVGGVSRWLVWGRGVRGHASLASAHAAATHRPCLCISNPNHPGRRALTACKGVAVDAGEVIRQQPHGRVRQAKCVNADTVAARRRSAWRSGCRGRHSRVGGRSEGESVGGSRGATQHLGA